VAFTLVNTVLVILFYDLLARSFCWRTVFLPGRCAAFTNFTEGMENQKCYGDTIDFTSGKFLTPRATNDAVVKTTGKFDYSPDTAKKLGVTQSLAEAQASCGAIQSVKELSIGTEVRIYHKVRWTVKSWLHLKDIFLTWATRI
jgi:hypothetical protein